MASLRISLCLWLILAITTGIVIDKVISDQQQCSPSPMKALFIFDKYDFKRSFSQLIRFLTKFVEGLPDKTSVYIVTVGNKKPNIFEFKKIKDDETWKEEIGAGSTTHDNIKRSTISTAICNFFVKNENPKMAEMIYLLVNEETEIDNIKNVAQAMEFKKRHIVLYGKHTEGDKWTELSMDEEHIQELGEEDEAISPSVQSVKNQSCIDSKYVCDTDGYWNIEKKTCNTCSYICSKTKSESPGKCHNDCPYYFSSDSSQVKQDDKQSMKSYNRSADCNTKHQIDDTSTILGQIGIAVLLIIIIIIILCCVFKKKLINRWTSLKKLCNVRNNNYENNEENNKDIGNMPEGEKDQQQQQQQHLLQVPDENTRNLHESHLDTDKCRSELCSYEHGDSSIISLQGPNLSTGSEKNYEELAAHYCKKNSDK